MFEGTGSSPPRSAGYTLGTTPNINVLLSALDGLLCMDSPLCTNVLPLLPVLRWRFAIGQSLLYQGTGRVRLSWVPGLTEGFQSRSHSSEVNF